MTGKSKWNRVPTFMEAMGERVTFLEGFARGADLRMEALEKRVYKLEDVVNEILQRGAGFGQLVQTPFGTTNGEQLPPNSDSKGGAE